MAVITRSITLGLRKLASIVLRSSVVVAPSSAAGPLPDPMEVAERRSTLISAAERNAGFTVWKYNNASPTPAATVRNGIHQNRRRTPRSSFRSMGDAPAAGENGSAAPASSKAI